MKLREYERPILNVLNNKGKVYKSASHIAKAAQDPKLIKYNLLGKIQTTEMKVNV